MTMRKDTGIALGVVLALAGLLGLYYFVHKPILLAQALALASVLADAGVAVLLTLLGGGAGRRLLRAISSPASREEAGQWVVVEVAVGWGGIGLTLLALGLAGLYSSIWLWALTLLALLALWRDLGGWLKDFLSALRALCFPQGPSQLSVSIPGLVAGLALALGLARALAPPVMWDALVYHLTLPKLYIQTHSVNLQADFLFTGMPQLTEMLYAAAMLLRGSVDGIAAQTLGWAFGALLALGLAMCASEWVGNRFAALAPAVLFSSFTLALSLAWAYDELLPMLFSLALLIVLRQWRLTLAWKWLVLGGVLAGLAMGCKYTAAIVPLAGAMVIFLTIYRRLSYGVLPAARNPRDILRFTFHLLWPLALFSVIAFLTFSPWLFKNLALTGNPVYPLFLPAGYMDALRLWFYNRPDLADHNPLWAAVIFLRATFLGLQGSISADGKGYDATLGPLFVCLLLGLAVGWHKLSAQLRREAWPLVAFVLTGYAAWVVLNFVSAFAVQARLFFAIFPALALLGVAGVAALSGFDTPALRLSVIVNGVLVLVLGLGAWENVAAFVAHSPLPYWVGMQGAAGYRQDNLGWYALAIDKVNALPPGARVEFLWETRSLECLEPDRCAPDVVIDRWWHLRRTAKTADAIAAGWKAQGFTHVLIYDTGADFVSTQPGNPFDPADWAELKTLRARLQLVENLGGVYSLYALP